MKRMTAILLTVALLLAAVPALAAGKIVVSNERTFITDEGNGQFYVYARLDNKGNKPIQVNAALLEVYDEDGDNIAYTSTYSTWAKSMEPGEYTYIKMVIKLDEGMSEKVDDYALSVTGKSVNDRKTVRLPSTCEYEAGVQEGEKTTNYMYCTLTNTTDKPLSEFFVCFALLDEEDNILYIGSYNQNSNIAVMPGSAIQIRVPVEAAFAAYMEKEGLAPAKADTIVYFYEDIVDD